MTKQVLNKNTYKTTLWSGGKTTEFFLFPLITGEFIKGKFDLRISSATIEQDESAFSDLSGYQRVILTLDNTIAIQHNDGPKKQLQPFELHRFKGSDKTNSYGKCTDFNIIYKNDMPVDVILVQKEGKINLNHQQKCVIYCFEDCVCQSQDEAMPITKGECIFYQEENQIIHIKSPQTNDAKAIIIIF